jgi:hypothetical protein
MKKEFRKANGCFGCTQVQNTRFFISIIVGRAKPGANTEK